MACSAASLTLRGVGKSGSPAPRSIKSTPSVRRRSASIKTASVVETSMPATLSDSLNLALHLFELEHFLIEPRLLLIEPRLLLDHKLDLAFNIVAAHLSP